MSKGLEALYQIYLSMERQEKQKSPLTDGDYKMFRDNLLNLKVGKQSSRQDYLQFSPDYPKSISSQPTGLSQLSDLADQQAVSKPDFEIGELYMVDIPTLPSAISEGNTQGDLTAGDAQADSFIFLLIGETGSFYTGFKVSEWVEFATSEDFIFEFAKDKWLAIMEELYIPKDKVNRYIGKIDQLYLDILFDNQINQIPIPPQWTGLTFSPVSDCQEEMPIQYKFRNRELKKAAVYSLAQFLAIDQALTNIENQKIISFETFQSKFLSQLANTRFPAAAHSGKKSARGDNFILYYQPSTNLLFLQLTGESLRANKVVHLKLFNEEYIFYKESDIIKIELNDYIDINYIAQNLVLIDE